MVLILNNFSISLKYQLYFEKNLVFLSSSNYNWDFMIKIINNLFYCRWEENSWDSLVKAIKIYIALDKVNIIKILQ